MTTATLRQQMQRQIEFLPDDLVREIADFMAFVLARRESAEKIHDWEEDEWQDFALRSFFRESDEVTYTLNDAQEVYHK